MKLAVFVVSARPAGGLEPLIELVENLPDSLGIAYVVVQHLSSDHESMLDTMLERRTTLPVRRLADGDLLEADQIFVLGPGDMVTLDDQRVVVEHRPEHQEFASAHRPIDALFSSLTSWRERSAAVVLSGTGNDGTTGIVDVNEAGGLTLAQDDSALFFDMPSAASRSGAVDSVGDPGELAEHITRYFIEGQRPTNAERFNAVEKSILAELEVVTGVNFDDYKRASVRRRLEHRMRAVGLSSLGALSARIGANRAEASALANDMLIGVTTFFRNAEVFEELAINALPNIIENAASKGQPIRCWSAGCATGQEAYSLAMALVETRDLIDPEIPIKIFATDVNEGALHVGREGLYAAEDMEGVDPERRERFFREEANGFRVRPELRGLVAFSNHNLLSDAPFTRIDLMLCRNTLICFTPKAQRNALWAFGFAIRPGGLIVLGESEALGQAQSDYEAINPSSCIHRKIGNRNNSSCDEADGWPASPRQFAHGPHRR